MKNIITLILVVALKFISVTTLTAQESYGKTKIYKKDKYSTIETVYKSRTFYDSISIPSYENGQVSVKKVAMHYFQVVTVIVSKNDKTVVKEKLQLGYSQYVNYEQMSRVFYAKYGVAVLFKGGRITKLVDSKGNIFDNTHGKYVYKGVVKGERNAFLKKYQEDTYVPSH